MLRFEVHSCLSLSAEPREVSAISMRAAAELVCGRELKTDAEKGLVGAVVWLIGGNAEPTLFFVA